MPRKKTAAYAPDVTLDKLVDAIQTERVTQGDIVRKVKLCGVSRRGKLLRPWNDCPEVDALIDTGATVTIISRALAELAGAVIEPGILVLHGRSQDATLMAIRLAAPGCGRSVHLVVVDDRHAASAKPHAFMILGHDYLQDNRSRIDYSNGSLVKCPPRQPASRRRGGSKPRELAKRRS